MAKKNKLMSVVREGNDWYIGLIYKENGKFVFLAHKRIRKLNDIKDTDSYVTLNVYVGKDKTLRDNILKDTGCNSVYILTRPSHVNEKVWNEYWWSDINSKCSTCKKTCKQSNLSDMYICPQYEEIKK